MDSIEVNELNAEELAWFIQQYAGIEQLIQNLQKVSEQARKDTEKWQ